MATITYEDVIPTLIPNTTMCKSFRDGVPSGYWITPVDGYVLHVAGRGWTDIDPDTGEEILMRGYTTGASTCGASYDFTVTTVIDGYTAYGEDEFFARPASEVPTDQIFGGVNK